jgi:hypothetical protein
MPPLAEIVLTVDVLDRLAKTLGVSISELFRQPRKGSAPPKPCEAEDGGLIVAREHLCPLSV